MRSNQLNYGPDPDVGYQKSAAVKTLERRSCLFIYHNDIILYRPKPTSGEYRIIRNRGLELRREATMVLYGVVMAAIIIALDLLFFRSRLWVWERLMANVGIVLVFGAFFLRFLRHP